MTDKEKAIVMAHTGICMLTGDKFQIFHKYVEDIMGRPILTHEIGFLADTIKEKSKADFIALCADESSSGSKHTDAELPKHTNSLPITKTDDTIKPCVRFNAIIIPDNATNGDVIKLMFPNVKIDIVDNTVLTNIDNGLWFSLEWWNAAYKKEVKE